MNTALHEIRHRCTRNQSGCWVWGGAKTEGYGMKWYKPIGRQDFVHRIVAALELGYNLNDASRKRLYVLHKCNNRLCCNPGHLYIGTPKENARDAIIAGTVKGRRGEKCNWAKLTEKDVYLIRRLRDQGNTHQEIADVVGISRRGVGRILARERWSHI